MLNSDKPIHPHLFFTIILIRPNNAHHTPYGLLPQREDYGQEERSAFVEFEFLKIINLKQTFTITKFTINKSYRICYVVKSCLLDWDSYAIPLGSGRNFSTYLVQSMKHFEICS